jgi:PAS domain-containing protein
MLQLVLDNIPQRVFLKDRNLIYLGGNRAILEDHPLSHPKEIVGMSDYDFFTAETAEAYRKDDQYVMETDTPKINYEEEKTNLNRSTVSSLFSQLISSFRQLAHREPFWRQ